MVSCIEVVSNCFVFFIVVSRVLVGVLIVIGLEIKLIFVFKVSVVLVRV